MVSLVGPTKAELVVEKMVTESIRPELFVVADPPGKLSKCISV